MPRTSFINKRHRSRSNMFHGPLYTLRRVRENFAGERSKYQTSLNCVVPVLASAFRLVPFGVPVVVLAPATGSSTDSDWHRFSLRSIFERQSCAICGHARFWQLATWQQFGLGRTDWPLNQAQDVQELASSGSGTYTSDKLCRLKLGQADHIDAMVKDE